MAKTMGLAEPRDERTADRPEYRAVTQGEEHEWAVVDDEGSVIFRGDARVAAMIASRLTRPSH